MIEFEQEDGVGRLTIKRAEMGNAFTSEMLTQTAKIFEEEGLNCDILVIGAEGEDFSLGRDRSEPKHSGGPRAAFGEIARLNAGFAAFPGIVIAEIKGRAFGFGFGLIMRSDIALCTNDARFMLDEVSLGFPPMFLMEVILDHIPPKRALDLILSSREFGASEALEFGLVSRLVELDELKEETVEYVKLLHQRDPKVLVESKRYLGQVRRKAIDDRPLYALEEQTRFALENH